MNGIVLVSLRHIKGQQCWSGAYSIASQSTPLLSFVGYLVRFCCCRRRRGRSTWRWVFSLLRSTTKPYASSRSLCTPQIATCLRTSPTTWTLDSYPRRLRWTWNDQGMRAWTREESVLENVAGWACMYRWQLIVSTVVTEEGPGECTKGSWILLLVWLWRLQRGGSVWIRSWQLSRHLYLLARRSLPLLAEKGEARGSVIEIVLWGRFFGGKSHYSLSALRAEMSLFAKASFGLQVQGAIKDWVRFVFCGPPPRGQFITLTAQTRHEFIRKHDTKHFIHLVFPPPCICQQLYYGILWLKETNQNRMCWLAEMIAAWCNDFWSEPLRNDIRWTMTLHAR